MMLCSYTFFGTLAAVVNPLFLLTYVALLPAFWLRVQFSAIKRALIDTQVESAMKDLHAKVDNAIKEVSDKVTVVRDKSLGWIPGWEDFSPGVKNTIAGVTSTMTLAALIAVVLATISWVRRKKSRIVEASSPVELASSYFTHILGVLVAAGVAVAFTIKVNSFLSAVRSLNSMWSNFSTSSWKKKWKK